MKQLEKIKFKQVFLSDSAKINWANYPVWNENGIN